MKAFLKKIIHGILKTILFLYSLLFPKTNKEKRKKEEIKKNTNRQKKVPTSFPLKNDIENSEGSRNIFKEHLKFKILPKEIEEELNKIIEENFKIKIHNLSEIQKIKLKEYTKKVILKVEKESEQNKIIQKEEMKKFLKEEIKKDIQKNEKGLNTFLEKNYISPLKTTEKKEFVSENLLTSAHLLDKQNTIYSNKKETLQTQLEEKNTTCFSNAPQDNIQTLTTPNVNVKKVEPTIFNVPENNFNSIEADKFPENNLTPVFIIKENTMIKQEEKEKQEQPKPKKEHVTKKEEEILPEKKKTNPFIEINFKDLERETVTIKSVAATEYNKEELIDKEYEEIETLIDKKIEEIEALLHKTISAEQKEKLHKELEKLKDIKEQVALHKEQDLEEYRISLEETISQTEMDQITEKLQEFSKNTEIEQKKKIIDTLEKNAKVDIEKIEKELIKEQFRKTVHRLEIPLFLSFPFIKNKHFRRFVGGLFLFQSFLFIKRWLFKSSTPIEIPDLSTIKKGSDALKESITITEKNIVSFEELKRATLEKYPELKNDEEFIHNINKLENKLQKNYEKLLKQEKVVDKYFAKSKVLIRKRKL